LIPASGFYEWSEPQGGRKRPYFIRPGSEPLFALGGLWERWRTPEGEKLETCVIVTTDANARHNPFYFAARSSTAMKSGRGCSLSTGKLRWGSMEVPRK